MKPTHRYGLLPNLDFCGVLGIVLAIVFVFAVVADLGTEFSHWLVSLLP